MIITEGDSAKTSALSGIAALSDKERQCYGVMAIKGKILNVRKSEQKAVKKNDEINNLISAWGLDNRTYDNEADLNTLRYGVNNGMVAGAVGVGYSVTVVGGLVDGATGHYSLY